ncbi:MAG: PilZ domain-containing protein [Myxococcales bacterium]|nr:PilZ domain-containing protein [Myxococcales bacterium]
MAVVVADPLDPERLERMRRAARRGGARHVVLLDPSDAWEALRAADPPPPLVLLDATGSEAERLVQAIRGEARLFWVRIVAVVPSVSEDAFREAFGWGVDDVVSDTDVEAMATRARRLADFDPSSRVPLTRGRALVAHPDEGRRRLLGRVLRGAGFDPSFAADAQELPAAARDASLLVIGASLDANSDLLLKRLREASETPIVLLAGASRVRELRALAARLGQAVVGAELAPPDELLFLANELSCAAQAEQRSSRRILHAALCSYRPEGSMLPRFGLTYNVSADGVFVRTLDPPAAGDALWFEMRPWGADRAVHLRARVVWTQPPDRRGALTPPGFAVALDLDASARDDATRWRAGYAALLDATAA